MNTCFIRLVCLGSFLFLSACAATDSRHYTWDTESKPPYAVLALPQETPEPPQGMRFGPYYVNALGEQCYEAYPLNGPLAQPRAFCRREEGWQLLPEIYSPAPTGAVGIRPAL